MTMRIAQGRVPRARPQRDAHGHLRGGADHVDDPPPRGPLRRARALQEDEEQEDDTREGRAREARGRAREDGGQVSAAREAEASPPATSATTAAPVLDLRGVSKTFGGLRA